MEHRGGVGFENNTGDGAGILTGLPHSFLAKVAHTDLDTELPPPGQYGVGIVFLPRDPDERAACKSAIETAVEASAQRLIGWRDLPTDPTDLGSAALAAMPHMEQVFIGAENLDPDAFERQLYVIRKAHRTRSEVAV